MTTLRKERSTEPGLPAANVPREPWLDWYHSLVEQVVGWNAGMVDQMVASLPRTETALEPVLPEPVRTPEGRKQIEILIEAHVAIARRLSDLIAGPAIAVLQHPQHDLRPEAPSEEEDEAYRIGTAIQRLIQRRMAERVTLGLGNLTEEIRRAIVERGDRSIPAPSRWLTTEDIAKRLSLSLKTVQRFCVRGLIDADKTGRGAVAHDRGPSQTLEVPAQPPYPVIIISSAKKRPM